MRPRALGGASAVVIAAALTLAACGGPAPTPAPTTEFSTEPSSSPSAVCALVTNMDALVGKTAAAAPSSYTVGSSERCLWLYASDPSRYVAVTLAPSSSHADTIDNFGDGMTVEGLGDDARWWEANRTLSVAAGDASIQVDVQLDDVAAPEELAVAVARAALASR